MVLEIPWYNNPDIDRRKRTVSFAAQAKSVLGSTKEQLAERNNEEPEVSPEAEDGRGGYNKKEYQKELEEIREKLPKEIQEFAAIFSTKK